MGERVNGFLSNYIGIGVSEQLGEYMREQIPDMLGMC